MTDTSMKIAFCCFTVFGFSSTIPASEDAVDDKQVEQLADEVRGKGWIVYSGRSDNGDWDLFRCRPDGSLVHNLTRTPQSSETAPQISRDGRRLLFRKLPPQEQLDHNLHGTQGELVMANIEGTEQQTLAAPTEYCWASWSPDGKQIACLSLRGVFFVDVNKREIVRRLPRKGFFQQLVWSPDGKWLAGVSNAFGASWSVGRMNAITGDTNAVSRINCCTPDWSPDSRSIIFSSRPLRQSENEGYGWTQLWMADAEGRNPRLVYGEEGRHIYGGHFSPDAEYVLFTGNHQEDGDPGNAGAPMGLMRLADAPIVGGDSPALRKLHSSAGRGPVLRLPQGWEPCWTTAEIGAQHEQR